MIALNTILSACITTLVAGVTAAPTFGPREPDNVLIEREATELIKRQQQQQFATQYWSNADAKLTWKSGTADLYSVNWTNPAKGNFVVGKGYPGQGM